MCGEGGWEVQRELSLGVIKGYIKKAKEVVVLTVEQNLSHMKLPLC
jgi:hypothetical protein